MRSACEECGGRRAPDCPHDDLVEGGRLARRQPPCEPGDLRVTVVADGTKYIFCWRGLAAPPHWDAEPRLLDDTWR